MENTSPKYFCFVLMPFNEEFDDIYKFGIKESCKEIGAYCERVDEQVFNETILSRIYNQISKSDLIIADMTGRNPNVFYEVGYAHAINKPTILLTQNANDIPFDLKHFPHIVYGNKITIIRNELTKRIKWFQEHAENEKLKFKTEIEIYVDDKNLAIEEVVHEYPFNEIPNFNFTIYNNSSNTYRLGEFQIGIITEFHNSAASGEIITTRLPNKKYLHMLPFFDLLFPGAYASSKFFLNQLRPDVNEKNTDFPLIFKVFTESGSRDYNLQLKRGNRKLTHKEV